MGNRRKKEAVSVRGAWTAVPLELLRSRAFSSLSPHATKLFFDFFAQMSANARGNGDLSASISVMRPRGWTSKAGLSNAITELLAAHFVVVTRQGGRRRCTLFALVPWALDCDLKKLDVGPGCYTHSDWTQGRKDLQEAPDKQKPAKWARASAARPDPKGAERLAALIASKRDGNARGASGAPGVGG